MTEIEHLHTHYECPECGQAVDGAPDFPGDPAPEPHTCSESPAWPSEPFEPAAPVRPDDWFAHSSRTRRRLAHWWTSEMWRPWYTQYLESELWQRRRRVVLARAGHLCESCMTRAATTVHHRTYARVGAESPDDLMAVCDGCHAKMHGRKE